MFLWLKQAMGSMKWYKSRKSVTCFGCGAWCAIFHPKMGLCQIFLKALLAGLTNQHDISDSFAVTPLKLSYSNSNFLGGLRGGATSTQTGDGQARCQMDLFLAYKTCNLATESQRLGPYGRTYIFFKRTTQASTRRIRNCHRSSFSVVPLSTISPYHWKGSLVYPNAIAISGDLVREFAIN